MFKLKATLSHYSVSSRLIILIGTTLFFAFFGLTLWTIIFHNNTSDISAQKWLQFFESIGMFVLPPFLMAYLWSEKPFTFLSLSKKPNWITLIYVGLFMLFIIPFINLLSEINHQMVLPKVFSGIEVWMKSMEAQATQITEKLLNVKSLKGLLGNVFLIALIPAFGEELFFRGTIQNVLKTNNKATIAIWVTAIIFSAIHFQFYGFIPRMLMGAFFGYLLFWSDSLWLPVLAHFINNATAIIYYYLKQNGFKMPDIDTIGTGNTWWLGVSCGVMAVFFVLLLKKEIQSKK